MTPCDICSSLERPSLILLANLIYTNSLCGTTLKDFLRHDAPRGDG
jgi:hypothetical protein